MLAGQLIQVLGTLLFCAVFLFLWRKSGVVYLGFWSLAWALASLSGLIALSPTESWVVLGFRNVFQIGSALALFGAAQASTGSRSWPASWWNWGIILALMVTGTVVPPWGHALLLAAIFAYSFDRIGLRSVHAKGPGGLLLRFTLVWLVIQYLAHVAVWIVRVDLAAKWNDVLDLVPQALLAFSVMVLWIQNQTDAINQLRADVEVLEKAAAGSSELDHLTGLRNRMALDRLLSEPFDGVVAVCDLDLFKKINDRFGHLVGDEVLKNVGHLIRASIRSDDEAFRWGGDEFVIIFRGQHVDLARGRMRVLQERLHTFAIRGFGVHPLGLSWGAAEGEGRLLRIVLEQADLQMYEQKRQAHAGSS